MDKLFLSIHSGGRYREGCTTAIGVTPADTGESEKSKFALLLFVLSTLTIYMCP